LKIINKEFDLVFLLKVCNKWTISHGYVVYILGLPSELASPGAPGWQYCSWWGSGSPLHFSCTAGWRKAERCIETAGSGRTQTIVLPLPWSSEKL